MYDVSLGLIRSSEGNNIPTPANRSTIPVVNTKAELSFTHGKGNSCGRNSFIAPAHIKVNDKITCAIQRAIVIIFDVFWSFAMQLNLFETKLAIFTFQAKVLPVWKALSKWEVM